MRMMRLLAGLFLAVTMTASVFAEETGPVYIIRIDDGTLGGEGMIDYWLVRFLDRHLKAAEQAKAKAVIFDIETNGGLVNAAFKASETILDSKIRTIAFVDYRAISAGALITLACREIYMLSGSKMGAALPIVMSPEGGLQETPAKEEEKMIRIVSQAFKATAEKAGHNTALAMAMVDPSLEVVEAEIDGKREILTRDDFTKRYTTAKNAIETGVVVKSGELFAPTTSDAVTYGLAKGEVNSLDELIKVLGFQNDTIVHVKAGWLDNTARFLAGPIVSALLILIAIIGIGVELKTPGFGAGGAMFILALGLYLWGKFFAGAATPFEIALFFVGLILLAIELFLIPGFGVTGITGVALILGSLILTALPPDIFRLGTPVAPMPEVGVATGILSVIVPLAIGFILLLLIISTADKLPIASRLVLEKSSEAALGETPSAEHFTAAQLVGKTGKALTMLRPAGRAEIDGHAVDVVTNGDYIPEGTAVKVSEVTGNRIVVERA